MAERQTGWVLSVASEDQGAIVVSWVGTTLSVVNAADFSRDGGQFTVPDSSTGGATYRYTDVVEGELDDDPDVITTVEAAPSDFSAERVNIWPQALDVVAEVELYGFSDTVPASVPHSLRPLLVDGVREVAARESVVIELRGQEWVVTDVVGRAPEIQGSTVIVENPFTAQPAPLPDVTQEVWWEASQAKTAADAAADQAAQAKADAAAATGVASQASQDAASANNQAVAAWNKALAGAESGSGVVLNGGAELTDASGTVAEWTPSNAAATFVAGAARSGVRGLRLSAVSGITSAATNWWPTSTDRSFYVEAWVKLEGASTTGYFEFSPQVQNASGSTSTSYNLGRTNAAALSSTAWTRVSATFKVTTADAVRMRVRPVGTAGAVYLVDDVFAVDVTEAKAAQDAATAAANIAAGAIKTTTVEYAVSSSETVAPTSGWSTDTPTRTPGTFVWMRTTVTRGDSTTSTTSPALLTGNTGNTGAPGAQGDKGDPGDTGVSVTSVTPYFRTVTPATGAAPAAPTTNPPPSPWTTTEPNYVADTALYRTERIAFSNSAFAYTAVTKVSSYAAAAAAMVSANGKNSTTWGTGATPPATTGRVEGDQHYRVDANGFALARWRLASGAWVLAEITSEMISYLDVLKLTVSSSAHINRGVIDQLVSDAGYFKALTTDKLAVTATNLIPNGALEFGADRDDPTNAVSWTTALDYGTDAPPGLPGSVKCKTTTGTISAGLGPIPVEPGQDYRFEVWLKANIANSKMHIYLRGAGNTSPAVSAIAGETFAGNTTNVIDALTVPTTWTKYSARVTVPANSNTLEFTAIYFNHSSGTQGAIQAIAGMRLLRMTGGSLIVDGAIDGKEINGADIYSPNKTATPRAHLGGAQLDIVRSDAEGREFTSMSFGGASADQVILYDATGQPISGFDSEGNGLASTMMIGGDLTVGGITNVEQLLVNGTDVMEYITPLPRGVVARQKLGTTAAGNSVQFGNTWLGYYELFFDSYANRTIRVRYSGLVYCSQPGQYNFELRYTATPGYATIPSSPRPVAPITGNQVALGRVMATSAAFYPIQLEAWFQPYGGRYRVLLSAQCQSSGMYGYLASHDNWPSWFVAEDMGSYVSFDDGGYNRGGGTPYSGTATETTPTTPKQTYTTTWDSAWNRSWRAGAIVTDGMLHQGYYGGAQRTSQVGFSSAVQTALSGSQIAKLELYMENSSWYYGSGGKLRIGAHGNASAGSEKTNSTPGPIDSATWVAGGKGWVTLPSSWYASFASGAYKGITLGEGAGSNMTYYGKFKNALASAKLRATYTK